jgi:hypothetical protein
LAIDLERRLVWVAIAALTTAILRASLDSTVAPCDRPERATEVRRGMGDPNGFSWTRRKNGEIIIERHGRRATVLRGRKAEHFLDEVASYDEQEVMARATGDYKYGNERESRNHPRNR